MLQIRTHRTFDFSSEAYAALFADANASAFQHPVRLNAFYQGLLKPRGADYDSFGRHLPGLHIHDALIDDWLQCGGTAFDFTIGDEPFKAQFGAGPTAMSSILVPRNLAGRAAKEVLLRCMGQAKS